MSRFSTSRLLGLDLVQALTRPQCAVSRAPQWARAFSQSCPARKDDGKVPQSETTMRNIMLTAQTGKSFESSDSLADALGLPEDGEVEPHHLHVFAHKHNTHITLSKPNRDAIMSLSCGNLGFKKSGRKHYDSAYQLGAYVVDKIHQRGLISKIHKLEVILRGFGPGREAVTKVLLGNEGKMLRQKIVRISDATRVKFGGTRSPKPRRLG